MSPFDQYDQRVERLISEFAFRIAVPHWAEFDMVWEAAMRVCDRYELGKTRLLTVGKPVSALAKAPVISSAELCAIDAPAQTHPPAVATPDSPEYEPAAAPPSKARPQDFSGC